LFLLLVFAGQNPTKASNLDALERLQARTPVEFVEPLDTSRVTGRYTNPPKDLVRRIGGVLSGDELYLFPDGTFIYCEWADIRPLSIYDKGRWTFTNGVVELKSDTDVTWDPRADRTYIAVRRRSQRNEVLLVGLQSELPHFEQAAGRDPELMLLIVSKGRRSKLTRATGEKIKARLLEESWHPEDFKTKPTPPHKPRR
jgi:hypothetical protein